MAFPKFTNCIICEGVRPETYGKFTLLGVFGVAPEVTIKISDLNRPIPLAILIYSEMSKETGSFKLAIELGPDLAPRAEMAMQVEVGKRAALAIGLPLVKFPKAGEYRLTVYVDEQQHFTTTFTVEPAEAADLS